MVLGSKGGEPLDGSSAPTRGDARTRRYNRFLDGAFADETYDFYDVTSLARRVPEPPSFSSVQLPTLLPSSSTWSQGTGQPHSEPRRQAPAVAAAPAPPTASRAEGRGAAAPRLSVTHDSLSPRRPAQTVQITVPLWTGVCGPTCGSELFGAQATSRYTNPHPRTWLSMRRCRCRRAPLARAARAQAACGARPHGRLVPFCSVSETGRCSSS